MLKSAIIGLGQIGLTYDFDGKRERPSSHSLAYQLNEHFQLSAATDVRQEQASLLHQQAPDAAFYTSVEEMFEVHGDLDVVSICTPPVDRLGLIQTVMRQPSVKVVFCEKPVAITIHEAKEIVALVRKYKKCFIPNLSRRWNKGVQQIKHTIVSERYGRVQKIHVRYTRGIYNTGSHLFDLIRYLVGKIIDVQVLNKVSTSSDKEGESSYSFLFSVEDGVSGFAEAFNDEQYYMFEMDLYFESGKIAFIRSGDEIRYYNAGAHPLFDGFKSLHLERCDTSLLSQSNLASAIAHLAEVINHGIEPICKVEDGVYPLYIAEALTRSYLDHGSKQKVDDDFV